VNPRPMTPWLPVLPDAIPRELRARDHWILWRAEQQRTDKKPEKVPYQVADPTRHASSTNPRTWGRFDDAVDAQSCPELRADGIAYALVQEDGITCLDLDRVIVDGRLDPRAAQLIELCGRSWTEISPSGTGLHVWVLGTVPADLVGIQIEVYSTARFMAVTGHRWPGTTADLSDQQRYLDDLVALFQTSALPRPPWTGPSVPPPDDLAGALIAKLATFGLTAIRLKRWQDGYLVELAACPWADEHTTGPGGAAVMIRASGAYNFTCLHAHCAHRDWRDFRRAMERAP
jgi:hypothetical protein